VFSEILYEEESIETLSGTTGWWGGDSTNKVWYNKDHTKTVRFPRLNIIQSVSEFQVFGISGGGTEYISYIDPNEQYVIVTIERPDMVGLLIGTIAAVIALGYTAIWCDRASVAGGGWCGAAIFALTIFMNILIYILGAIANYNYEIWGRPIGHEKRTFQSEANDEAFQQEIGKTITETIEDPFCYSVQSCRTVAQNELDIVMAQRNRIKFQKLAHMQDEIGDVIQINHPYSGEIMKTFVTTLERKITIGKSSVDKIEGWRLLT
jgi:septum formation topological specificity factor MinE